MRGWGLAVLLPTMLWAPSCAGPAGTGVGGDALWVRADTPEAEAAEAWAVRAEAVVVSDRLFEPGGFTPGDTLSLDVFGEGRLRAVVRATDSVGGQRVLRARLAEPEEGDLLLAVGDRRAVGSLHWRSARRAFYLRYDGARRGYVLVEADPSREDVLPGAPPPPTPPR